MKKNSNKKDGKKLSACLQPDNQLKRKRIITAIMLLALVAVYLMIFFFSAENGENSSKASMKVTEGLFRIYYRLFGMEGAAETAVPIVPDALEGGIRKLAHFTEYMAVGLLSFGIASLWVQSIRKGFCLVVVQLAVSAALDEIHQYFVPGRYSSVKDVILDTLGGITGMLLVLLITKIKKQNQE